MDALRAELTASQGDVDFAHFGRVHLATEILALVATLCLGLPTRWLVAPVLFAVASTARWTMVAHHVGHGGYDYRDDARFHRGRFALGARRRFLDWFDWMLPEAWNTEHNHSHHYSLNEDGDPDLVEHNLAPLRAAALPLWAKRGIVVASMGVWKWLYYAPNTFKYTRPRPSRAPLTLLGVLWPGFVSSAVRAAVLGRVLLPYFVYRFVLFPLPWLAVGLYGNAVCSLVVAEVLANVYAFVLVVPNHAGRDLWRFGAAHAAPYSGTFYRNQILGSTNYPSGTDAVDFAHGWLNYQIEHHLFPSLGMLAYRRAAPRVRALCAKHGLPYVQETVWVRLGKAVDIMIGKERMRDIAIDAAPLHNLVSCPKK